MPLQPEWALGSPLMCRRGRECLSRTDGPERMRATPLEMSNYLEERQASEEPDREYLKIWAPVVLVTLIGLFIAWEYVEPPPPERICVSAGGRGGAYYRYAELYRENLAASGITLDVRESAGSVENLRRLLEGECEIAFLQGGIAGPEAGHALESLASLYFEPLWVFHQDGLDINHLTDLKGLRIGTGAPESGTEALARVLLAANGIGAEDATFASLGAAEAAAALRDAQLDIGFFVSGWQAPLIQKLVKDRSIHLMSFDRDEAYEARFPFLSSVVLPEGSVDLETNIPSRDTTLLSPTANLIARKDLHPALVDLLVSAANEVHHKAGIFSAAGEFPSTDFVDLPLRDEALRSLTQGPSFLNRVLPFWLASKVHRLAVLLLPLLTLLLPLVKVAPPLYRWRVRRKIYRWYKYLRAVDLDLANPGTPVDRPTIEAHLEELEQELNGVNVPLSYMDEFYHLKVHIALVREKLGPTGNERQAGLVESPSKQRAVGVPDH